MEAIIITSPEHTRVAGSGFHIPSPVHTALLLPAGTNPGLHLKIILAPSVVSWYVSMEPFSEVVGTPQLTGNKNVVSGRLKMEIVS